MSRSGLAKGGRGAGGGAEQLVLMHREAGEGLGDIPPAIHLGHPPVSVARGTSRLAMSHHGRALLDSVLRAVVMGPSQSCQVGGCCGLSCVPLQNAYAEA